MTDEPVIPEAVAEIRVEEALAALDVAVRKLELAQQRLSRVNGVVYERKRLGRLHEQVQLAFNNLMSRREQIRRRGGLSLDELV